MSNIKRTWSQYNDESFKKLQMLEAVIATNKETSLAYGASVDEHTIALATMKNAKKDKLNTIIEKFDAIILAHKSSKTNLDQFNIDANKLLNKLRKLDSEKDAEKIELVNDLLAIFKF